MHAPSALIRALLLGMPSSSAPSGALAPLSPRKQGEGLGAFKGRFLADSGIRANEIDCLVRSSTLWWPLSPQKIRNNIIIKIFHIFIMILSSYCLGCCPASRLRWLHEIKNPPLKGG